MKLLNWLMKLKGITAHCDNCGYNENIENFKLLADSGSLYTLLNKRCPKCGHNMIDENDLKEIKKALGLMDITDKPGGIPIRWKTKSH